MKYRVESPTTLVEIGHLDLAQITANPDGSVTVGALVRNSDLADHALIKARFPVLSQAFGDGRLVNKNDAAQSDGLAELIARNGGRPVEAMGSAEPGESRDSMTSYSWGAVFAEVAVDRDTHMVKVRGWSAPTISGGCSTRRQERIS